MTNKPENPQAFPRMSDPFASGWEGMTLRDYFAGQALAGLAPDDGHLAIETVANCAYRLADAMLKERSK